MASFFQTSQGDTACLTLFWASSTRELVLPLDKPFENQASMRNIIVRVPAEVPLAHSHTLACSESPPGSIPGYSRDGLQSAHRQQLLGFSVMKSMHKSSLFFPAFLKGKKNQLPTFSCLQIKQIPVIS